MPVQRFAPMTKDFATMKVPASGSHETRRWREGDSNPPSLVAGTGQAARNHTFKRTTGAEAYFRPNKAQ
jgi:hypothetical protein